MALLTNDIYVGSVSDPLYHFTNADAELGGFKGSFALDVIVNELSIDQFSVVIRWTEDDMFDGFITSDNKVFQTSTNDDLLVLKYAGASTELKDFLKELPFGTPVWWYVNDAFYAKGYLKSVDRVSKHNFKITCVSGVGLLDTSMHTGGIYQSESIYNVLSDIIGSAFTFVIMTRVSNSVTITGHLPYDTARNNLHRVLFSCGAILGFGFNIWDYAIDFPLEGSGEIPASKISLQSSVQYQLPANKVEVTEHSFYDDNTAQSEVLYDTEGQSVTNLTVVFDKPIVVSSLTWDSTMTVPESHTNYVVISGSGKLYGRYYIHGTNLRIIENNPNNDAERVRRVTDNELINSLNSYNVAKRVLTYYQSAKTVKAKIVESSFSGYRPGFRYKFNDAFGDLTQGYLVKQDSLITALVGMQCQFVCGYQPNANGNTFLHRKTVTISTAKTWIVPAGVTYVRIALIGGGSGGQGGKSGEKGKNGIAGTSLVDPGVPDYALTKYTYYDDTYSKVVAYKYIDQGVAQGGDPGVPGTQGKVYVIERTVTPGEVLTFAIGLGGDGGASGGGVGSLGTDTTVTSSSIGTESSASGTVTNGYVDPMTGAVYAKAGTVGMKGGNGGQTDSISLDGNSGGNGLNGGNCGAYNGGAGGAGYISGSVSHHPEIGSGGGGGGGAYGAIGGAGRDAVFIEGHYTEYPYYVGDRVETGSGGDGATALPPEKPTYGCAGNGGNGGGGGGNVGGGQMVGTDWTPSQSFALGSGGAGGFGSPGGEGGDGLAIIYW